MAENPSALETDDPTPGPDAGTVEAALEDAPQPAPEDADGTGGEDAPAPGQARRFGPSRIATIVAAVTAALALGFVAYLLAFGPDLVIVDGAARIVPRGSTVRDLAAAGVLTAAHGDLIAVNGSVARRGGGGDPVVADASGMLRPDSQVRGGTSLTSARGPDVREEVTTTIVLVEPETMFVGSGLGASVAFLGTPGETSVTMGAVSRIEIGREVVSEPVPRVVLRGTATRGPKYIALTFDDGPWPGQTQRILEILESRGAKATFFLLGLNVQRNPSLAKRVAESGNEVATHSQTHKLLARAPKATTIYEIATGARTVERYTGVKPYWYRPAGGSINPFVRAEAKALGLKLILWNVDTHDYRKRGVPSIVNVVVGNAKNGSVVLMHDGGGDRKQTIAALPVIIDVLRARGFNFVTLTELYDRPSPPKMPVGQ